MRPIAVVIILCVLLGAVPAHALDPVIGGLVMGALNSITQRPTVQSSVTLAACAELRWRGAPAVVLPAIVSGSTIYALAGTEVVVYPTAIKFTPGDPSKIVVCSSRMHFAGAATVETEREPDTSGAMRQKWELRVDTTGLRMGIWPITLEAVMPNGTRKGGFLNLETRTNVERQQSLFNLVVLKPEEIERLVNNEEVQRMLGYAGSSTGMQYVVPVLPGSGPQFRLAEEVAQRYLMNAPGAMPMGGATGAQAPPTPQPMSQQPPAKQSGGQPQREERSAPSWSSWPCWREVEVIADYAGYRQVSAQPKGPLYFAGDPASKAGPQPYVFFVVRGGRIDRSRDFCLVVNGQEWRGKDDGDGVIVVNDFDAGFRVAPVVDGRRLQEFTVKPGQGIWYPVVVN